MASTENEPGSQSNHGINQMRRLLQPAWMIALVLCIFAVGVQDATACAPASKLEKSWSEILKDDYTYADQVFIGTVIEVQKIQPSGNEGAVVDRIRFSVEEMIKGDRASVEYAETLNIDDFTSGCGYRLKVGERDLVMIRDRRLIRAVDADERWDSNDPEITVKTVRGFRDRTNAAP